MAERYFCELCGETYHEENIASCMRCKRLVCPRCSRIFAERDDADDDVLCKACDTEQPSSPR